MIKSHSSNDQLKTKEQSSSLTKHQTPGLLKGNQMNNSTSHPTKTSSIRVSIESTSEHWQVFLDACLTILDGIDKKESSPSEPDQGLFKDQLLISKDDIKMLCLTIDFLKPNRASLISILRKFGEERGLNMGYLPDHISAPSHHSLTYLLNKSNSPINTVKANRVLIELGLIEGKARISIRRKLKKYKVITEKGKRYGLNQRNPEKANETRPHWYEETFPELLKIILEKHQEMTQPTLH